MKADKTNGLMFYLKYNCVDKTFHIVGNGRRDTQNFTQNIELENEIY